MLQTKSLATQSDKSKATSQKILSIKEIFCLRQKQETATNLHQLKKILGKFRITTGK